jgi:hypothetical protein
LRKWNPEGLVAIFEAFAVFCEVFGTLSSDADFILALTGALVFIVAAAVDFAFVAGAAAFVAGDAFDALDAFDAFLVGACDFETICSSITGFRRPENGILGD